MSTNKEKTRCFISLSLPSLFVKEIVSVQQQIQHASIIRGKFTKEENIHLTLKFLGEITDDQIRNVDEALQHIHFKPFSVKLADVGVFSKRHIRIIWMHLLGADEIQNKVDEALSKQFKPEERFMSHITMARVKHLNVEKEKALHFLDHISTSNPQATIDSFTLKKSTLTPQGPNYKILKRYRAG